MKTASATSAWLFDEGSRLDASFHLSEGREAKILAKKSPHGFRLLEEVSRKIFNGSRFKRTYVDDPTRGYPYLTASDMTKAEPLSGTYLSQKMTGNTDGLMLYKGLILISCSGTIGKVVFTNEDFEGQIGTHDLIRILPNADKLEPGYLYAFLSSKYGYAMLTQSNYGGVVKHIEPHHISDLPIPLLPERQRQEIHRLVEEAAKLRVQGNGLLREVIKEIEEPYNPSLNKKELIFTTNISEVLLGDKFTDEKRLEADFYQPATKNLISKIKSAGKWSLLGDITSEINISNLRARSFVKKGIALFTGQSLGLSSPDLSKQLSRKLTRNIEENTTKDGDILVSAFGTIGKVELAYKNFYTGIFASQQIARIRTVQNELHSGYLFAFLSSKLGQSQILKFKTGSVIEWLNSQNFASIVVPVPDDKGNAVGEVVFDAVIKRQKAFELETKAITILENEIYSWQPSKQMYTEMHR